MRETAIASFEFVSLSRQPRSRQIKFTSVSGNLRKVPFQYGRGSSCRSRTFGGSRALALLPAKLCATLSSRMAARPVARSTPAAVASSDRQGSPSLTFGLEESRHGANNQLVPFGDPDPAEEPPPGGGLILRIGVVSASSSLRLRITACTNELFSRCWLYPSRL